MGLLAAICRNRSIAPPAEPSYAALGMRTLIHRCVAVMFLAIAAAGILAGQTDVEALRAKAEQGATHAQHSLGLMYGRDQGVARDYLQAHMWVNLAASKSQGEKNERYAKSRKLIAEEMTSVQIAEAQRLAREWKQKTWDELKKGLETESR